MKKVYYIFVIWTAILSWCVMFGKNPYINIIVLFFGLMGCVLAFGYVMEHKRNLTFD